MKHPRKVSSSYFLRISAVFFNQLLPISIRLCLAAKPASQSAIPRDHLGMLEYKREDEARLVQNIILGIQDLLGFSCLFIPSLESSENIKPLSRPSPRAETQRCGGQHDPRPASVHPVHVHPPR